MRLRNMLSFFLNQSLIMLIKETSALMLEGYMGGVHPTIHLFKVRSISKVRTSKDITFLFIRLKAKCPFLSAVIGERFMTMIPSKLNTLH